MEARVYFSLEKQGPSSHRTERHVRPPWHLLFTAQYRLRNAILQLHISAMKLLNQRLDIILSEILSTGVPIHCVAVSGDPKTGMLLDYCARQLPAFIAVTAASRACAHSRAKRPARDSGLK